MPFFSLVIPTYNRADLLKLALQSVLEQTFKDIEVVVSNGGSTDNTREVVRSLDDARIKYLESDSRLSAGENYQRGLEHATGEFITFLSDDDAFVPVMLERVKRIIDEEKVPVVAFRFAHYYHTKYVDFYHREIPANTLEIENFTSSVTRFSAEAAADQLFSVHGLNSIALDKQFIVPYLANAVYHKSIFAKVKTVNPTPFNATPADMYMAAAVFFAADSYYCLDEPLHVWSRWEGSSTPTFGEKGNALREHYQKLLAGETLRFTPLTFELPYNCAVNAILQARKEFGAEDIEIEWPIYYKTVFDNLTYLKELGLDISAELQDFEGVLAAQPASVRDSVRSTPRSPIRFIKKLLRMNAPPIVVKTAAELIDRMSGKQSIRLHGNAHGFRDVLGAARLIGKEFLH